MARIDKYTWYPGDVEVFEKPHWDVTYERDGWVVLVQDADGLMQHLIQHGGGDDLQGALESFLGSPRAELMPEAIRRELEGLGVLASEPGSSEADRSPASAPSPFDAYPDKGRKRLGPPASGDGTARHGYGREVHRWCGFRCAYCDLDLGSFEGWLQLSIDHVVPQQMARAGWPKEWLLDKVNVVACCMACNGLFNRDPATGDMPTSLDDFLALRDAMFLRRRTRILERRAVELAFFHAEVAPAVAAAQAADEVGG